MIPKAIKILMLFLAVAMVFTMVYQYQNDSPVTFGLLLRTYLVLWALIWGTLRIRLFTRQRILEPTRSKLVAFHNRKQAEYVTMTPAQKSRTDEADAVNYKAGVTLVGLGTALVTFLINPIGGAIASWRMLQWAKREWRDTNEQATLNADKRAQEEHP